MNRRDFVKFMSVTPAVAAASNALAKIVEAENRIEKLEPTEIQTDQYTFVFDHIRSYSFKYDLNYKEIYAVERPQITLYPHLAISELCPHLAISEIEAEVYLFDETTIDFNSYRYIKFNSPELKNKTFVLHKFEIIKSYEALIVANIKATEIGESS